VLLHSWELNFERGRRGAKNDLDNRRRLFGETRCAWEIRKRPRVLGADTCITTASPCEQQRTRRGAPPAWENTDAQQEERIGGHSRGPSRQSVVEHLSRLASKKFMVGAEDRRAHGNDTVARLCGFFEAPKLGEKPRLHHHPIERLIGLWSTARACEFDDILGIPQRFFNKSVPHVECAARVVRVAHASTRVVMRVHPRCKSRQNLERFLRTTGVAEDASPRGVELRRDIIPTSWIICHASPCVVAQATGKVVKLIPV